MTQREYCRKRQADEVMREKKKRVETCNKIYTIITSIARMDCRDLPLNFYANTFPNN